MAKEVTAIKKELMKLPNPHRVHAINALNIVSSGFNIVIKRVAKARLLMYYSMLVRDDPHKEEKIRKFKAILRKL